jgi:HK97 gp10 family phage protein
MAEVVRIEGLEQVKWALKQLPKEIARKELYQALRPAAKLVQRTAQSLAPVGLRYGYIRNVHGNKFAHYKGTLRNSIVIRREKKKYLNNTARLKIGVLSSHKDASIGAFYWRFVEFGTRNMSAHPFLRPAFELLKYDLNIMIQESLGKGVQRQAARVRRTRGYAQVKGRSA